MLNLAILFVIWRSHPAYLSDYRLNANSDARHYVQLGDNIILRGEFSRCSTPPYVPDMLRTPVVPLLHGILHQSFGPRGIYVFHALLQIAACGLLYRLVGELIGSRAALIASWLLATDFALAVANFEAMSEPIYLFLNLSGLLCVLPPIVNPKNGSLFRAITGGVLLALATLSRPTGLYVPFLYAIVVGFAVVASERRGRMLLHALTTLIAANLPVALWIARNWVVFSLPRLTTADAIMLVYFFGAGGYQAEHDLSLEEAQERIGTEYSLPSPTDTNNHWRAKQSVSEMDAALRRAAWPVVTKYPDAVVRGSAAGIAKATISHNVGTYAHITGRPWNPVGLTDALSGNAEVFPRLTKNAPDMILLLAAELAHSAAGWSLAVVGIASTGLSRRNRFAIGVTCIVLLYFAATLAIVGLEAYWRYRLPHMPLVYVLAGAGTAFIVNMAQRATLPTAQGER